MSFKKKIVTAVLIFIFTFIFIDVIMLSLFPINCQTNKPDEVLHHVLIANSKCPGKTQEFNVIYSANEYGLRDVSFANQKSNNTFRMLFLGDSFTYGTGVNLEDTFAKQFEKMINEQNQSYHVQAINAGVPAYGLLLEELYLKSKGIEFAPDLVVVNLSMTDFFDERRFSKIAQKDLSGQTIAIAGPITKQYLPSPLRIFFKSRSFTYNLFLKKQEAIWKLKGKVTAAIFRRETPEYAESEFDFTVGDPDKDTFAITREINGELFDELFPPVAQRLISIKKLLDERNIPMVLVVIPNGHQVDKNQWTEGRKAMKLEEETYPDKVFEELEKFSDENKIQFINTVYELRKHAQNFSEKKLFFDYDGHLTPFGNKIIARSVLEKIDLTILQ